MNNIAISVKNVSKKFRLFNSPRERLLEALHPFSKKYHKEFWALRDVNFEVKKGQTLGIIGRNGAGKSTLLQILCSILRPTEGTITTSGKVSALLALGAGFNPEFTGRQNVLMNGVLMGFSQEEMKRRLPAIEDFADIGEFIDQPMKIYSSGMGMRLAFAAAVNVEPDILIVDEVLAVGDVKFQNKCYRKFNDFRESGKTIIFVTHNTELITRHCDSAVLLDYGKIIKMGEPKEIVNLYMDILLGNGQVPRLVKIEDGRNIVSLHGAYYAVPLELGNVDLTKLESLGLPGIVKIDVKQDMVNAGVQDHGRIKDFLHNVPPKDGYSKRKSYNKNEFRQGDNRALIMDYLLVCADRFDPAEIAPNDKIDVYIKVVFNEKVNLPVFGIAVKSLDGIRIWGTNTFLDQIHIPSVNKSEMVIFKFSVKMALAAGDFFLTLAIVERSGNEYVFIDHRTDIIHLLVKSERPEGFHGFVELESESKLISHNKIA